MFEHGHGIAANCGPDKLEFYTAHTIAIFATTLNRCPLCFQYGNVVVFLSKMAMLISTCQLKEPLLLTPVMLGTDWLVLLVECVRAMACGVRHHQHVKVL